MLHLDESMSVFTDGDLARPNLFMIHIPHLSESAKFMAKGGSIPQISNGETSRGFMGYRSYLAGDPQFEPWTVTFYNDAEFGIWDELHAWLYQTHATDGNIFGATPAEYKRIAYVTHYKRDTSKTPIKSLVMHGLFPTTLGDIRLDWEDNNQVETFDVTFRFDYFVDG